MCAWHAIERLNDVSQHSDDDDVCICVNQFRSSHNLHMGVVAMCGGQRKSVYDSTKSSERIDDWYGMDL